MTILLVFVMFWRIKQQVFHVKNESEIHFCNGDKVTGKDFNCGLVVIVVVSQQRIRVVGRLFTARS